MKCLLMMMGVLLIYSCGTKHKLQRQSAQSTETKLSQQQEAQLHYRHAAFKQQSDSATVQQWFKIYPKGELQFNNGNFSGQVDSLLWYTSSINLKKELQSQQKDTLTSYKQETMGSSLSKTEEGVKEKQQLQLNWLPLGLILSLGLILYLVIKKIKQLTI